MSEKSEFSDLQQFFIDTFRGIKNLNKKIDEINEKITTSSKGSNDEIIRRIEQLEDQFYTLKETTELLNELLAELRLLVPVLHLNKLIEETKSIILQKNKVIAKTVKRPIYQERNKTETKIKETPPSVSPFAKQENSTPVNTAQAPETKKEPDVIYSSKIPSYIKEKKKPKSLWAGILDEEQE